MSIEVFWGRKKNGQTFVVNCQSTGCSLNIVFFPITLEPLCRQHSAAMGCTKIYQPTGVSWTPCRFGPFSLETRKKVLTVIRIVNSNYTEPLFPAISSILHRKYTTLSYIIVKPHAASRPIFLVCFLLRNPILLAQLRCQQFQQFSPFIKDKQGHCLIGEAPTLKSMEQEDKLGLCTGYSLNMFFRRF